MKNNKSLRPFLPKTSLLTCIVLAAFYSASPLAVTLYKWTDAEGNVSYQDHPPPVGQKYEEKYFSDQSVRTGDINAEVARSRAIGDNPVTLYIAANCESCDRVGTILGSNNVPYEIIEVDIDQDSQKNLIELVRSVRVPTLAVGNNVIDGYDRAAIEDALTENGYPEVQIGVQ
jgi:glutaredoxin